MKKLLWILPLLTLIGCASTPPMRIDAQPIVEAKLLPRYLFQREDQYIGPPPVVGQDVSVLIDIDNQNFHYYENGLPILSGVISSGTQGHPTPRGTYRAGMKDKNKKSSLYPVRKNGTSGGANMHYAIQIAGDYFLHEGYLPGTPASHGCVRVWTEDAKFLFRKVNRGDKIVVR